jgi:hypothetical protein
MYINDNIDISLPLILQLFTFKNVSTAINIKQIISIPSVIPHGTFILTPLYLISDVHVREDGYSKNANMWRTNITK